MANHKPKFESIYDSASDRLFAYALRRTDQERALEVVSEVWLVAWRRLPEIPDNSLPWLIGVARKVLANQWRAEERRQSLVERLKHELHCLEPQQFQVSDSDHLVSRTLAYMSPNDKEALCLVAWEGMSPRDAAASMGCSTSVFSVRLHRARRRFIALYLPMAQAEAVNNKSQDDRTVRSIYET